MPRRFFTTVVAVLVVILGVIGGGLALAHSASWTAGELGTLRSLSLSHTSILDAAALALNWLFSPPIALLLIAAIAALIGVTTRSLKGTLRFIVVVTLPWLGSEVIKLVVHRPRPDYTQLAHPLIDNPGSESFPSGHTVIAAALGLALVAVAVSRSLRIAAIAGTVLVALATAWSRIYLGVHYPTDVIASLVYAVAAVVLVNAAWQHLVASHWARRRL